MIILRKSDPLTIKLKGFSAGFVLFRTYKMYCYDYVPDVDENIVGAIFVFRLYYWDP